jgi:hypothetical protein
LGEWKKDRDYRAKEHQCEDALKAKGLIR